MFVLSTGLLLFGLGIFAQLLLSISRKFEKSDLHHLLIVLGLTLLTTLGVYIEGVVESYIFSLEELIIIAIFIFSLIASIVFIKKILPQINELVLIVWNVGFWYLYLSTFGLLNSLIPFLLVPSLFSIFIGIFRVSLGIFSKAFLYVWFMIIAILIAFMLQTLPTSIRELSSNADLLRSFFLGMTFFYVITYFFYIVAFISQYLANTNHLRIELKRLKITQA